jgi:hypothetical protein
MDCPGCLLEGRHCKIGTGWCKDCWAYQPETSVRVRTASYKKAAQPQVLAEGVSRNAVKLVAGAKAKLTASKPEQLATSVVPQRPTVSAVKKPPANTAAPQRRGQVTSMSQAEFNAQVSCDIIFVSGSDNQHRLREGWNQSNHRRKSLEKNWILLPRRLSLPLQAQ